MTKRRILGVVPVRSGSKGIKDKNIQPFQGRPLFMRALTNITESEGCDKVIVSTESKRYAEIAKEFGASIPFLRPATLAKDQVRLHYVLKDVLDTFDARGEHFDAVFSIQATAPLLHLETICKMIDLFHDTGCLAVGTGSEITHGHPYLAKTLEPETGEVQDYIGLPRNTPRYPRQVRPALYFFNGAAFLRDRKLLDDIDDTTNCLGLSPKMVLVDDVEGLNIDSPLDLEIARWAAEKKEVK